MISLGVHNAESIRIIKTDYPAAGDQSAFVIYTIRITLANGQQTEVNVFGAPGLEVTL
jgi:hypothetical protein